MRKLLAIICLIFVGSIVEAKSLYCTFETIKLSDNGLFMVPIKTVEKKFEVAQISDLNLEFSMSLPEAVLNNKTSALNASIFLKAGTANLAPSVYVRFDFADFAILQFRGAFTPNISFDFAPYYNGFLFGNQFHQLTKSDLIFATSTFDFRLECFLPEN